MQLENKGERIYVSQEYRLPDIFSTKKKIIRRLVVPGAESLEGEITKVFSYLLRAIDILKEMPDVKLFEVIDAGMFSENSESIVNLFFLDYNNNIILNEPKLAIFTGAEDLNLEVYAWPSYSFKKKSVKVITFDYDENILSGGVVNLLNPAIYLEKCRVNPIRLYNIISAEDAKEEE